MRDLSGALPAKLVLAALAAVFISAPCAPATGQEKTLREKAIAEFESANYPAAIEYLEQARAASPDDAEIYYYLGYYTHYLCYDSVPLTGFGREKSDEVLRYLEKAVELDHRLGNAYYFLGAEYGARSRDEMQRGAAARAVEEFRLGRKAGGYPDWMIEYGRNMLRSCEPNAILFTGGDADTNPVEYLQAVEGYRTDVTTIPLAILEWPRFVAVLKGGVPGILSPAPIGWSDEQIASMHPYKWKKNVVRIPVPREVARAHGSDHEYVEWELSPNLGRGAELGLLSAGRAVFADILVTNAWRRPVYFSLGCSPGAWEGLDANIQLCGVANRLLPFAPESNVDVESTSKLLLDEGSFAALPTLRDTDMPRVSGMLQNYRVCFLSLAHQYAQRGELDKAKAVLAAMAKAIPEDILPIPEQYGSMIEALRQMLDEKK
jgi:tetratricopeptide (TPR) repeat protein